MRFILVSVCKMETKMGTYTTNYQLYTPTVGEQGWGDLVNGNFTTIDTTMKSLSNRITAVENKVTGNDSITTTSLTCSGTITANGGILFTPKTSGTIKVISLINMRNTGIGVAGDGNWHSYTSMTLTNQMFIMRDFTSTWTVGVNMTTSYSSASFGTRLVNVNTGEVVLQVYGGVTTSAPISASKSITMKAGESYRVDYNRGNWSSSTQLQHTCTCGTDGLYF